MDLYLRIEDRVRRHLGDLQVSVEPSHTIRDVADAVARHLGLDLPVGFPVSKAGVGQLIDGLTVVEAGLLSGQTLVLGPIRAPGRGRVEQLSLVVASGPSAGERIALEPGLFTVGREADCDLELSDPQVSRRHLRFRVDRGDRVTVESLVVDRNPATVGGAVLVEPRTLDPDDIVRVGASSLAVRTAGARRSAPVDAFGHEPFHRTPYFPAPVTEVVIAPIPDVPARPEKSRFAYLAAVLPVLMGVSFAFLMGNPRYLLFAVFSPVMVIGNYIDQRRRSGKAFLASVERFETALEAKAAEVGAALAAERSRRFAAAPDIAALTDRARTRDADLWVRDRAAEDFLRLRIGLGVLPAAIDAKISNSGDVEFRDQIVEAYGRTEILPDVPITIDLASLGVVGLVGRTAETSETASSLVLQAACLHSPEDVVVLGAVAPARAMADWLRWVPHSRSTASPLAGPQLVGDKAAADGLLIELINEATRRTADTRRAGEVRFPWLLVVLDRALEPDAALVSRLLDGCGDAGMSVLWLTDSVQRVPRQAAAVVDCQAPRTGRPSTVSYTDPDQADHLVDLDRVGPELAGEAGRALAPLRDASSANAATAIPRVVPLFTALGIESVDADWVARQWQTDRGYSLQGPIGCTEGGPLMLDVVEHGPHGLIGGTSGAGKSELVMSLVAGLIATNPPSKINFLFIDYKGGASSALFADVPHTVGYVTNLDGLLAMRALTSLRAELNRRMDLLQGRAKDLAEMIEKYPDEAPPSLVIVVDEFATLVNEIPDFVAGIVDIAQRGRSLGIHLLLATQRPSGSVNDNIKANTNLRISLRMLDGAESTAVIGSPEAAAIPAPLKGRGLARMGSGDLVAFQSAWAGAPLLAATGSPPVGVGPFGPGAAASLPSSQPSTQRPVMVDGQVRTQIDALLDAVTAADALGHQRARAPWLPMLDPVIPLDEVRALRPVGVGTDGSEPEDLAPGRTVAVGMIDDPAAQAQYPAVVDLARSGGLLVFGTGGSGKTTVLQTVALSAALDDDALGGGQLSIFAIDFASRELGGLARLPQCGAVATGDDLEAVTRVIGLLAGEFERRRQALADAVARAEQPPRHPVVLVLIDGMDALVQAMEQGPGGPGVIEYYTKLVTVITDGRQVGIHPVITAARRTSIKAGISSAISDRLVLRQTDVQGYTDTGISAADAKDLDLRPGQGFLNGPNLIQVAQLGGDRERFLEVAAALTGSVDERLVTAPLPRSVPLLPSLEPLRPAVGLADFTSAVFELDLTHDNVSVIGDPRTGRSSVLATIGLQVASAGVEVFALGRPGSPLAEAAEGSGWLPAGRACFETGAGRLSFVQDLLDHLDRDREHDDAVPTAPPLLLLDDHDELPESDRELTGAVERLLERVRWVAAGSKPRGFSSNPIAQVVKGARTMVYLKPHDPREAHETMGMPVPWHPGLPSVEGRGYVLADRIPTMVQFANPAIEPAPVPAGR